MVPRDSLRAADAARWSRIADGSEIANGSAQSVSDVGVCGPPAARRGAESKVAEGMPAAGARRRFGPAVVGEELSGRLHVVQLGEPHVRGVADVRGAQAADRSACRG